jgi:hypothetical protein
MFLALFAARDEQTMDDKAAPRELAALRDYVEGRLGTREAIEKAGLRDYAELIIALAQLGLALPRPPNTAARRERVERARAILQPRLRRAA